MILLGYHKNRLSAALFFFILASNLTGVCPSFYF